MIRLLVLLGWCVGLTAAVLPLGAPMMLDVHPDGGRLQWRLELPAGTHAVLIDEALTGGLTVQGASWRIRTETIAVPPPDEPADLPAAVQARNRHAVAYAGHQARQQAQAVLIERLAARAAASVEAGTIDAVQAAIAAAVLRQEELDVEAQRLAAEARALRRRAALLREGNGIWLAVNEGDLPAHPLTLADARRAWRGPLPAPRSQRVVDVVCPTAAVVEIVVAVPMQWSPAATVHLDGDQATLTRRVHVTKPVGLDLKAVPLRVHTQRLAGTVWAPDVPRIRLGAEEVLPTQAKAVTSTALATTIPTPVTRSESDMANTEMGGAGAFMAIEAEAVALAEEVPAPAAPPITREPGFGVLWDLGTVALPSGVSSTEHSLPAVPLTVLSDEWALIPALATVAIRRCVVQLDAQPLLDGPLTVITNGRQRGTTLSGNRAPGTLLELRADEDATVFAASAIPWDIAERDRTSTRRREGSAVTIHHFGTVNRSLAYYAIMPIGRSADLRVEIDPQTTSGGREVAPGIWRWELDLMPTATQVVELGWILHASGGLKF